MKKESYLKIKKLDLKAILIENLTKLFNLDFIFKGTSIMEENQRFLQSNITKIKKEKKAGSEKPKTGLRCKYL